MTAGQASLAWLCMLCLGLAAAFPARLTLDERVTCFGAVNSLRTCNAELPSQELQQRCCIPFHALEGMDCFCDNDVAAEALTAMRGSAIGGLFACGLDTPFTAIYERQERCVAQARAAEFALLPEREEGSVLDDSAALAEDAILAEDWDSLFGFDSREDALDFLDDEIFEEQVEDDEDNIFEMMDDVTEITISADGLSEVVVTVPSDDGDVDVVFEAPEADGLPALIAEDVSDSSVTSLYDADFSDVNSMVSLLSGWLGVALGSAAEKPNGDEDTVGSLSQALAEILASLQATFAGTPLDVEISYEGGRDGALTGGDTEIDIEIDPKLLPIMEPQFLDQRLLALSQKWNGRAVRPAPGRIPEADLLELVQGLDKETPSLANCFNSGICNWLCRHRRTLQYALGAETVLLVALFVLYARYNRRTQEAEELDADEEAEGLNFDEADICLNTYSFGAAAWTYGNSTESLRAPLIVSAADYADAPEKEPLWTLTTKVAIQHQ